MNRLSVLLLFSTVLLFSSLMANANASTQVYNVPTGDVPKFLSGGYDIKQIIVSDYFQDQTHVLNVTIVCVDTIGFCGFNISNRILDWNGFTNWMTQHKSELSDKGNPIWNTYISYYQEYFYVHVRDLHENEIASMMTYPTPVNGHPKGQSEQPALDVEMTFVINWKNVLGKPETRNNVFEVFFNISNYPAVNAVNATVSVECEWRKFGGTLKEVVYGNDKEITGGIADKWSPTKVSTTTTTSTSQVPATTTAPRLSLTEWGISLLVVVMASLILLSSRKRFKGRPST